MPPLSSTFSPCTGSGQPLPPGSPLDVPQAGPGPDLIHGPQIWGRIEKFNISYHGLFLPKPTKAHAINLSQRGVSLYL